MGFKIPTGTYEPSLVVGQTQSRTAELAYWQDRAAMLDPAAHVMTYQTSNAGFTLTVPGAMRWHMRNGFALLTADSRVDTGCSTTNGSTTLTDPTLTAADAGRLVFASGAIPAGTWLLSATSGSGVMTNAATSTQASLSVNVYSQQFHRDPSLERARMMPAGEVVTGGPSSTPFAYICQPELVIPPPYGTGTDVRYLNDPRDLFFSRLRTLQSLSVSELTAVVAPGAAAGSSASVAFPGGFTNGIVMGYTVQQAAWAGLLIPAVLTMNLWHEISNNHEFRVAFDNMLLPFSVATFSQFKVNAASVPGDLVTPVGGGQGTTGNPIYGSRATLRYFQLPGGW